MWEAACSRSAGSGEWRFYRHGLDGSQNREAGRANAAYNIPGSWFTI